MSGFHKKPSDLKPVEPSPKLNEKLKEILFFGADVAASRLPSNDPVGERLKRLLKTIEDINTRVDRLMGGF